MRSGTAILALAAVLSLVASAAPGQTPRALHPSPAAARYLALGDSYTFGEGVKTRERYSSQLVEAVRGEGIWPAEPESIAENGWTSDDLLAALASRKPAGPFALVTLLIGANDQFQHRSLDDYRRTLRELLARAVELAGCDPTRVIVLSIPDWSVTPFAGSRDRPRIAGEIARFNEVSREETTRAGAHWLDVTAESQGAADDRSLLAADGLHPSAEMHRRWAALLQPIAVEALRDGRAACTPRR